MLTPEQRRDLRAKLEQYFSKDEIHTLCFDLGEDPENLSGGGKQGEIISLVLLCERNHLLPNLLSLCAQHRSQVVWPAIGDMGLSTLTAGERRDALSLSEVTAVVSATNGAVHQFDKVGGQVKSVLLKQPKEAAGDDNRWRFKVGTQDQNLIVEQDKAVIQTVAAAELAKLLKPSDLALVQTYEKRMERAFDHWRKVYDAYDPLNPAPKQAKTEARLRKLVLSMRSELIGILEFLEYCGVYLDDHYMYIRYLVAQLK